MKVDHPKVEFIYKNLRTYFYMFKLQSPSKYSPFDATHLSRFFSTAQNRFWTYQFWCLLVLLLFFLFHLFHIGKTFPFEDFFIWGNKQTKKLLVKLLGCNWVNREDGVWGLCCFWSKLLTTQCSVGRWARNSPIMKWANTLKDSSKQIHWSHTQPLATPPVSTLIQVGS